MIFNFLRNKIKFFLKKKKIKSSERIFFEKTFISSLNKKNISNVLFLGIGPYTYHYSELFKKVSIDFYSLDNRKETMLWAYDKSMHKIFDVRDDMSDEYNFKFDLIVFMGMVGYGINDKADLLKSITNLKNILNDQGCLLIAYESKFGINVEESLNEIDDIELRNYLGFDKKIIIDDDFYRFYFYRKK